MSATHQRVSAGSLILLADPREAHGHPTLDKSVLASSPAQAQARLRAGATTALIIPPAAARPFVDQALAKNRPVIVAGSQAASAVYGAVLDRPYRHVELDSMELLGVDLSKVTGPKVIFGDLHQCWRSYEQLKAEARARLSLIHI